jgi:thioredoxin-like negative regulator of GroEL
MSPASSEPREYGDRDLPALIERSAEPVVLESHFAGWEAPWRGLSPEAWQDVSRALGGRIRGARVETGRNREFALRYRLEIIPAVLVFHAGEEIARFTGNTRALAVIDAVRAALQRSREAESARRELESARDERAGPSRVRSVLRRRANERALARAG